MKKLLFLLFLIVSASLNAQTISWKKFDEKTMNDVLFAKVSEYITSATFSNDKGERVKGTAPVRYDANIKCLYSDKLESFDKVSRKNIRTYQDPAERCINDWKAEGVMGLILWTASAEISSKYKKINQTVYVWFTARSY